MPAAPRFPLIRALLREGALEIETPLPDGRAGLAARTMIQCDGDAITKYQREAGAAAMAAHFAAVEAQLLALQAEIAKGRRWLAWALRGLAAGRLCLLGGVVLGLGSAAALLWGSEAFLASASGRWMVWALWGEALAAAAGAATELARPFVLRRLLALLQSGGP